MTRGVHNPTQLDDTEVRTRFVVRALELEELLAHLREGDPPRHALVIGQRGMGKSLLLRRLAIAVGDDADLEGRWLPVLMPEEMYAVTSLGDLWLAALDQVATAYHDESLAEQHAALRREPDPARMESLALQRLLGAARSRGRKILLLAENLDMLLADQVDSDGGWALRQALQTENDILLVASAVTSFAQIEEAGEAFYGFFHRLDLDPLDDDDVRTLWSEITGENLAGDRVVPIRILAGGNPRLVTVLAHFARRADLPGLRDSLELLIDEYTPYFKANIEMLPVHERKVFVTLADIWAPATSAEVAAQARMSSNKVSSLLGRLVRRGAVRVVDQEQGRQRYELTERLYNLYHLLRRPDGEGRVRALVDILTHLYEPAVLERDVLPAIVLPGPGTPPPSLLDTSIASRLGRLLDEAGVWHGMSPEELQARLPTLEALLERQLASAGTDTQDSLLTRRQIAVVIGRSGDAAEAAQQCQEISEQQRLVCGPDSDDALASLEFAAYFAGMSGDAARARDLYGDLARSNATKHGATGEATVAARTQHAYFAGEAGDLRGAVDLYTQLAADCGLGFGAADPRTLAARHHVARYTGLAGDPQRAVELFRGVVDDQARVLGRSHLETFVSRKQLAYYLADAGAAAEALAVIDDLAVDAAEALPADHLELFIIRRERARITGNCGDTASAVAQLSALVADVTAARGADDAETLLTRYWLAYNIAASVTPDVARAEFQELAREMERVFGANDLRTLTAKAQLLRHSHPDDHGTAADVYAKLTEHAARIFGPDHRETLEFRHRLAAETAQSGDTATALDIFRRVANDCARVLGPEHPATLRSLYQVAVLTGDSGDARAAVDLLQHVAGARGRVHGEAHAATLNARTELARFTANAGDSAAALAVLDDVQAVAAGSEDDLADVVAHASAMRTLIEAEALMAAGEPVPRELREAVAALAARAQPD